MSVAGCLVSALPAIPARAIDDSDDDGGGFAASASEYYGDWFPKTHDLARDAEGRGREADRRELKKPVARKPAARDAGQERRSSESRSSGGRAPGGDAGIEPELVGVRSGGDSRDFFEKGSATSVFSSEARLTEKPALHILNASLAPEEEPAEEGPPLSPEQEKEELDSLPLDERLERKYGEPEAEPKVLAQENAPKPFKAMMEALQEGDDKLAYKYARQYVRYMQGVKEKSIKVVEMSKYARQREGFSPKDDAEEAGPDYNGTRYLYEEDMKEAARGEEEQVEGGGDRSYTVDLDETTREILAKAEAEEDSAVERSRFSGARGEDAKPVDERSERLAARLRDVPVDRGGRALVYYFFRPADSESFAMAEEIEKLAKATKAEGRVDVVGFTMTRATSEQLALLKRNRKLSIPVRVGNEFAARLKVKTSPTTVVVAPTSGKAVVIEGIRPFFYVDEIVKMVVGR